MTHSRRYCRISPDQRATTHAVAILERSHDQRFGLVYETVEAQQAKPLDLGHRIDIDDQLAIEDRVGLVGAFLRRREVEAADVVVLLLAVDEVDLLIAERGDDEDEHANAIRLFADPEAAASGASSDGRALLGLEQVERLDLEANGLRAGKAGRSAFARSCTDAPKVLQPTERRQLLAQVIESLRIGDQLAWDRLGHRSVGRRHRGVGREPRRVPRGLDARVAAGHSLRRMRRGGTRMRSGRMRAGHASSLRQHTRMQVDNSKFAASAVASARCWRSQWMMR